MVTIICSVLVLASEMMVELGVDTADRCPVIRRNGHVIQKNDDNKNKVWPERMAALALSVQRIKFKDGNLSYLATGFPQAVSGDLCISCLPQKETIISDCSVSERRRYSDGEVEVQVTTTNGTYGTHSLGFREVNGSNVFEGGGDVTRTGDTCAVFVFSEGADNSTSGVTYLEYSTLEHCDSLLNRSRKIAHETGQATVITEATEGPTSLQVITCKENTLPREAFREALRAYRSIQIENTIHRASYDKIRKKFESVTGEDVIRAALAFKLAEANYTTGSYDIFPECGKFNWPFAIPFVASLACLATLYVVSSIHVRRVKQEVEQEQLDFSFIFQLFEEEDSGSSAFSSISEPFDSNSRVGNISTKTSKRLLDAAEIVFAAHGFRGAEPPPLESVVFEQSDSSSFSIH